MLTNRTNINHPQYHQMITGGGFMKGSVIRDKRSGNWRISIYWESERYLIYSHPVTRDPFVTKNIALKHLAIIQGEIDQGIFQPKAWLPDSPLSTRIYATTWAENVDVSEKTKRDYKGVVKNYIIPFFGDKDIRNIRYNDICAFKKYCAKKLMAKGVYNKVGTLKTLLHDAWKNEDIPKVPPFPELQNTKPAIEYLTLDQQMIMIDAIPERHRPIFALGMEYGLRTQEVRAIQKDCIIGGSVLVIKRKFAENKLVETTKTGEKGIRYFELTEYAKEIIKSIEPNLSPFVFVRDDGKPYTNKNLNTIWHEAEQKTGITCKLQNAMRHSLGCQLLDQGENIDLIKDTLGHTNIKMTERYAQRKPVKVTDALEKRRANVIKFEKKK